MLALKLNYTIVMPGLEVKLIRETQSAEGSDVICERTEQRDPPLGPGIGWGPVSRILGVLLKLEASSL